jgi:hypothetical protein
LPDAHGRPLAGSVGAAALTGDPVYVRRKPVHRFDPNFSLICRLPK